MLEAQNKTNICLCGAPSDEWPSGIDQLGFAQRLEEKVRESQRNMAEEVP